MKYNKYLVIEYWPPVTMSWIVDFNEDLLSNKSTTGTTRLYNLLLSKKQQIELNFDLSYSLVKYPLQNVITPPLKPYSLFTSFHSVYIIPEYE